MTTPIDIATLRKLHIASEIALAAPSRYKRDELYAPVAYFEAMEALYDATPAILNELEALREVERAVKNAVYHSRHCEFLHTDELQDCNCGIAELYKALQAAEQARKDKS